MRLKIRCDEKYEKFCKILCELNKASDGTYFKLILRCKMQDGTDYGSEQLLLRPCLVRKNFQDFPSHRIFGRMYRALNIDENKN